MKIIGIDLSLTSTGLGLYRGGLTIGTVRLRPPPRLRDLKRMHWICREIGLYLPPHMESAALAVIEGPSYGSASGQKGHHERAGLWWLIRDKLHSLGIPVAVVPPKSLKLYAAGSGNAAKADMLAAARQVEDFDGNDDEADALWLAAMGADHLGDCVITVPESHRAALKKVAWPDLPGDQS